MTGLNEEQALFRLLKCIVDGGRSELLLTSDSQPLMRVDGSYQPVPDTPSLAAGEAEVLLNPLMTRERWRFFVAEGCVRFGLTAQGLARFRVEIFATEKGWVGLFRRLHWEILTPRELCIPDRVVALASAPQGLLVFCGPPSSGKSTTEAAIVDLINRDRSAHIIVLEECSEYDHAHKRGVISQCIVDWGSISPDTFVPRIVRRGPDVVVIRDIEYPAAMDCAVELARCGVLVIATICATSAVDALRRIATACKQSLAPDLLAVVSQRLLPKAIGRGTCLAMEVVIADLEVRRLIREGRFEEIPSHCRENRGTGGHMSMTESAMQLYSRRQITVAEAERVCDDPVELGLRMALTPWPIRRISYACWQWLHQHRHAARHRRRRVVRTPYAFLMRLNGPHLHPNPPRIRVNLFRGNLAQRIRSFPAYLIQGAGRQFWLQTPVRRDPPKVEPWHRRFQ